MFYTLLIHQAEPHLRTEATPGEDVIDHIFKQACATHRRNMFWMRSYDMVATIGFDFEELPLEMQTHVREHMKAGVVIRLSRA